MQKENDWQIEFDRQFQEIILDQEVRTVLPGIKHFIHSTLSNQRSEIVERVQEILNDFPYGCGDRFTKCSCGDEDAHNSMQTVAWARRNLEQIILDLLNSKDN